MWILPDQTVVRAPRPVKVGETLHPAAIFKSWSDQELAAIGIKPYSEDRADTRFYSITNTYLEEVDGVVYRRLETAPRYNLSNLKQKLGERVRGQLKIRYRAALDELNFLAEFDSASPDITTLEQYKADLKTAYQNIKADVLAISDYDTMVQYDWTQHYPADPLAPQPE